MVRTLKAAMGVSILAAGLTAGVAQAAFVNGSMSLSDGGLTVPPVPSTSIVSQLTSVTQGTANTNSCTGDLSLAGVCLAATAASGTISLTAPAGTVYTYAGFTFTLTSVTNIVRTPLASTGVGSQLADALAFTIIGTVSGNGFQPTTFSGLWTGNGSCQGTTGPATCTSNVTASWSVSLTALGTPTVPEPATLGLIGIALAGLGFAARRKQA
jgi:PEP-CTERM motif